MMSRFATSCDVCGKPPTKQLACVLHIGMKAAASVAPPRRAAPPTSTIPELPEELRNKIMDLLIANSDGSKERCALLRSFCNAEKSLCPPHEPGWFRELLDNLLGIDVSNGRQPREFWDYGNTFVQDRETPWKGGFFSLCNEGHLDALVAVKEEWQACKLFQQFYEPDRGKENQTVPFTLDVLYEKNASLEAVKNIQLMAEKFMPLIDAAEAKWDFLVWNAGVEGFLSDIGRGYAERIELKHEVFWPWFPIGTGPEPLLVSLVAMIASLGMVAVLQAVVENIKVPLSKDMLDSEGSPILVTMVNRSDLRGEFSVVVECMQLLIAAGRIDVNYSSSDRGLTPLFNAVSKGNLSCTLALLQANAAPDLPSGPDGESPAQRLARYDRSLAGMDHFVATVEREMAQTRQRLVTF